MSDPFEDFKHLGEIESDGRKIANWSVRPAATGHELRYLLHEGRAGGGFYFCCICNEGSDDAGDLFSTVFYGVAYFDGVRHLHFVGDPQNYGYFNYPHLNKMRSCLEALMSLERKHCDSLSIED